MHLFLNEVKIPKRALIAEAALRRIDKNHSARKEIEEDYAIRMAGYRGEKSVDYYLKNLPETHYDIIHGLRLPSENSFFQIDTLILSTSFAYILEIKNIAGILHFEKNLGQFLRITPENQKKERFRNPIQQAKIQHAKLQKWLYQHGYRNFPVDYVVVNSNARTIITTDPGNEAILTKVCNSETIEDKIIQTTQRFHKECINHPQVKKLEQQLLHEHTEPEHSVKQLYNINSGEIPTGVQCPKCLFIPMSYHYGTWTCLNCNHQSKTAHIAAIQDYFHLIKPTITNIEMREFLHIQSPNVAKKFLHTLQLPSKGVNKGRIYSQL